MLPPSLAIKADDMHPCVLLAVSGWKGGGRGEIIMLTCGSEPKVTVLKLLKVLKVIISI